ncbi:PP2C family protein-serine/threonine phosphatase [Leisingera sp. ANG-Vp]|uniref:PP2C family protein-serine/threonine phosphatase n=1 Tax=Leisingera sp. ANG-Vp TaxID=1577896 RepID=UPI00068F44EB|nr:protein phosphatase 2C domain-containing protein [Leisingera sp. ANG-Vp]
MPRSAEFSYDAATAISQGRRERQEDAVAADFLAGAGTGFAVLADGMGGHAAGDIASKIVVTEVFSDLKLRGGDPEMMEGRIGDVLQAAAEAANACLGEYAGGFPESRGMGATLLAPVLFQERLYWISVGDSPLYLFRGGRLLRLNAEHSLAAEFAELVAQGRMPAAEAASHPDRHCVTSVLNGGGIRRIDCRRAPVCLQAGDILLAASDGLQFLAETEIAGVLTAEQHSTSARIGAVLMQRLEQLGAPEQDNAALCVIKPFAQRMPAQSEPAQARPVHKRPIHKRPAEAEPARMEARADQQPAGAAAARGRRKITLLATVSKRGGVSSTCSVRDVML